jgi:hypothetical protein
MCADHPSFPSQPPALPACWLTAHVCNCLYLPEMAACTWNDTEHSPATLNRIKACNPGPCPYINMNSSN